MNRWDGYLTPKQAEVVYLVSQGRTNTEIAGLLGIAAGTVKYHLRLAALGIDAPVPATRTLIARWWWENVELPERVEQATRNLRTEL